MMKTQAIIYVITGGPFSTGAHSDGPYERYLTEIKRQLPNMNLYMQKRHNSSERIVCREIKDQKRQFPQALVVLSGHSYGSEAAVRVSKCLEKANIDVDLLLTADTVPRVLAVRSARNRAVAARRRKSRIGRRENGNRPSDSYAVVGRDHV